jgi:hypothetical protein
LWAWAIAKVYGISTNVRMKAEQVSGKIRLNGREVEALFDTGASKSVMPKSLALELGCYRELPDGHKYELSTAKKGATVRIIGDCRVIPEVAGCKVPSTTFEVSEDVERVIIGRPQLDEWEIVFTPQGPRPRRVPIRLELI